MRIVESFMGTDATSAGGRAARKNRPRASGIGRRAVLVCSPFMLHRVENTERADGWSDALERGRIVEFPRCPIELPSQADQDFLREGLAPFLRRKNVSWYPRADKLTGLQAPAEVAGRARQVLRDHSLRVRAFLEKAMPDFTRGWDPGTSSFRP